MSRTVLLFDVDGVLVNAHGYKEALRDSVSYFAEQLGSPDITVTDDIIAEFEAMGVTNEWESLPFCVSLMLQETLKAVSVDFVDNFNMLLKQLKAASTDPIAPPDFVGVMRQALDSDKDAIPSHKFLAYFKANADAIWHQHFDLLLGNVFDINTPTTDVFQMHTLGADHYQETYDRQAALRRKSYLLEYDTSNINTQNHERLISWSKDEAYGVAIFTARPSKPPKEVDPDAYQYAPEGDLAQELLAFKDLPLMAGGRLSWLAENSNASFGDFIKPSPMHALASILAALTKNEEKSLLAAAKLVSDNDLDDLFAPLQGETINVIVFEDSSTGILSTMKAGKILQQHGIYIAFKAVGVATEPAKVKSLDELGAHVVSNVNEGIEWLWSNG